jgi:hypothetical protein
MGSRHRKLDWISHQGRKGWALAPPFPAAIQNSRAWYEIQASLEDSYAVLAPAAGLALVGATGSISILTFATRKPSISTTVNRRLS